MIAVNPFRSYVVATGSPGGANTTLSPATTLGAQCEATGGAMVVAVCKSAKPSRILRCRNKVQSVCEPVRELTVEVDANASERIPKLPLRHLPLELTFRGERLHSTLVSYHLNEMLATKMRAMFQRKIKGGISSTCTGR